MMASGFAVPDQPESLNKRVRVKIVLQGRPREINPTLGFKAPGLSSEP